MICRMDWDSYQKLQIPLICLISFEILQKNVFICFKDYLLKYKFYLHF